MKNEFHVLIHRNDENVHFKLTGDFDEKAASEFMNALDLYAWNASRVFVHTDALNAINDFDEQRFKSRLYNNPKCHAVKILPTGRFSRIFIPPEHTLEYTLTV
ncbi:MAG: hypothetical protein JW944_02345 [Deltaproteobacteria bacterium]|nr:hypothetical protein [Deltaproteobacteria bacterium]